MLPNETYLVISTTIKNNINKNKTCKGWANNKTPKDVAMPLPPLKL